VPVVGCCFLLLLSAEESSIGRDLSLHLAPLLVECYFGRWGLLSLSWFGFFGIWEYNLKYGLTGFVGRDVELGSFVFYVL